MKRKLITSCSICLNSFTKTLNSFTTECKHTFHTPCLYFHIAHSMKYTCPLCRKNIIFKKDKNELITFIRRYCRNVNDLLHASLKKNNKKCLSFILKNMDNDFLCLDIDNVYRGVTPLIICAKLNRVILLNMLLKNGASPDVKDKEKKTALMHACENANFYAAKKLADVNNDIRRVIFEKDVLGLDSIIYTIMGGSMTIFNMLHSLLGRKSDFLNNTYTEKKIKPVVYAISYREYPMFLKLMSLKPDVCQMDTDNNNALHYTCMYDNFPAFLYIHRLNSSLSLEKNNMGDTPLHLAVRYGNIDIVKFIVISSEPSIIKNIVSIQDADGQNIFEIAAQYNRREILDFLLYGGYFKKSDLRVLTHSLIDYKISI